MPRYANYGPLDNRVVAEGDQGFRSIDSYLEPTTLTGGQVEASENFRLEGDTATVRKGLDFLAGGVTLTYSAGTEEVFASGIFSDPLSGDEYLIVATKDKAILWNDSNASGLYIDYDGSEVVAAADGATFTQNFDKMILWRGSSKRPLEWDGDLTKTGSDIDSSFDPKTGSPSGAGIACPNSDYGLSFRNRLIIPQPTDTKYTVLMSDLLDSNNFTTSDSQFRINKGSADYLVGFYPYMEDQLIVFMRNSIHLVNNVATTSAAGVYEISREYGCVARKSIAASGPQYYFLSDSGVMVMQQGLDPAKGLGVAISKISGEAIPLSRQVQDQFADVNFAAASGATGIVFDNKYYLAVPTGTCDSASNKTKAACEAAEGTWTGATTNTAVFIYDILNGGWSSVDRYPDAAGSLDFAVDDWVICSHGSNPTRRRLFACNTTGWYLMEENETDDSGREIGSSSESGTTAIPAKLKTRSYTFGDMSVKSWHRGQLGVDVTNGDAFTVKLNATDPDSTNTVHTESAGTTEDKIIRFGMARARGYSANLEIDVTAGRPEIRHCLVEATGVGLNVVKEVA